MSLDMENAAGVTTMSCAGQRKCVSLVESTAMVHRPHQLTVLVASTLAAVVITISKTMKL